MRRLGVLLEPARDNPAEAEGVLNPAAARAPDGQLYLFPRLVGDGNYSRIGIGRVHFNAAGDPCSVERLGVALEPIEAYEKNSKTGGGCEDPRITFVKPLGCYVMAYTAYGPEGPRIALAASEDLLSWERLGLVQYGETAPVNFNNIYNKDGVLFPDLILGPDDEPSLGLIHRPLFPGSQPHEIVQDEDAETRRSRLHHESLWISYCRRLERPIDLCHMENHHRLMSPRYSWERIKVGAGTPPLLTQHGWLLLYHGVSGRLDDTKQRLRYSAGALVLDAQHADEIRYRSRQPVLAPEAEEREGLVPNVVFPTAIDQRTDLGQPERVDVYYGMADDHIGVATLTIPAELPDMEEPSEDRRDAA